jgi:hypothetical protein
MDHEDMMAVLAAHDLEVDEGCLIGGPFIPDGRVRIYRPDDLRVMGEGKTFEEAFEALWLEDL